MTVVVDPGDYRTVLEEMDKHGGETTLSTRFNLARKVFRITAAYDKAITEYLANQNA